MKECTVPVVIPSYEPDERLLILLDQLCKKEVAPIIIVDDGSSAEYRHFFDEAEEKYHAIILRHDINQGKGRGLKTAFSYCLSQYPELLGCVTADSDGQHSVVSIIKCKEALKVMPEHLVLGVRDFDSEDVPAKSQLGNKLTRNVFKILCGIYISDTQTGLRGIPKEFMNTLLEVEGERFEFETRMLVKAVESGVDIEEVKIETIYDSKENHSTHFRPVADSIRIYRVFGFSFGKFVLSSFSSSIIDLVLFQTFCFLLSGVLKGIEYVAFASIGARIISAIYNYWVNYFMVFNSKKKHQDSAIKYFLLVIAQMGCSALLTTVLVGITGAELELIAKIPVDIVLFLISYQIQRKYVY